MLLNIKEPMISGQATAMGTFKGLVEGHRRYQTEAICWQGVKKYTFCNIGVMKTVIKMTLKALGKTVVSGIIAFVVLSLFCFFYYNLPARSANSDGSTDWKREANAFRSRGTEGFAWGKTNNDGFTNMFDYDDDIKIDILIMGSSHMEAYEVGMSQSVASRLNALLEKETVYNIGVSMHNFLRCASNLRAALNKYQPTKYVVIETSSISFSDDKIVLAIREETAKLPPYDTGIVGLLQKNPYLRLINQQIQNIRARDLNETKSFETFSESGTATNENLLADLLQKMSTLTGEYGAKVIIVYHPSINIASDGSINLESDQNVITRFKKLCDDNGVLFLDMSNRFKKEYENAYILPYGFSNSSVGQGHLNEYGHAMMADELYNLISEETQ